MDKTWYSDVPYFQPDECDIVQSQLYTKKTLFMTCPTLERINAPYSRNTKDKKFFSRLQYTTNCFQPIIINYHFVVIIFKSFSFDLLILDIKRIIYFISDLVTILQRFFY